MHHSVDSKVPTEVFASRREAAMAELGQSVLLLSSAPVQYASRDTERPHAPDRELYYLTGLTEPESVAVLVGGDDPSVVVFVRDRDPDAELWAGPRREPAEISEALGLEACHSLTELPGLLPELLDRGDRVYMRPGRGDEAERLAFEALARARARGQRQGTGPRGLIDPGEILDDLRLVKDQYELELIRVAAEITVQGHLAGASAIREGVGEWVIEAAVEGSFRAAGATGPGFDTIVGSGENGCILHYVENDTLVPDGSLVLVDAGAEYGLYHGDVTRTYPASGRFTGPQREVYDIVEAALGAGVEASRPGATIASVHEAASRVLTQGLVDLGVLDGSVDDLIELGEHKAFFPHQTSHWLGLDVHDPGDYARSGTHRALEPGMVLTVEPGLYFRTDPSRSDSPFEGIGIRIEDDIVVTAGGCDVLTRGIPTGATEIEGLMAG